MYNVYCLISNYFHEVLISPIASVAVKNNIDQKDKWHGVVEEPPDWSNEQNENLILKFGMKNYPKHHI